MISCSGLTAIQTLHMGSLSLMVSMMPNVSLICYASDIPPIRLEKCMDIWTQMSEQMHCSVVSALAQLLLMLVLTLRRKRAKSSLCAKLGVPRRPYNALDD